MSIGIFWFFQDNVIGKLCSWEEGEQLVNGIVDSPFNHYDLWENTPGFLNKYPMLYGSEYQTLPRGRVLYSTIDNKTIIYMDATLFTKSIKKNICEFFQLSSKEVKWRTDPHYITDHEIIESYFND